MIVRLDKLSLSMEEGQVLEWLVADGDEVTEGQPLAEIETDKATEIIESPGAGVIRLLVTELQIVPVETPLAQIGDEADQAPAPASTPEPAATPGPSSPAASPPAPAASTGGRAVASPAARAKAQELGIDLSTIVGTGPGGRIVVEDVVAPAGVAPARHDSDLRGAVVAGLTASWSQIPHIHIVGELVADGLVEARRLATGRAVKVTVSDLLILAVARALHEIGDLNGTYVGGEARRAAGVNLGLAVATDRGITAPVIRGAEALDLEAISAERARLVEAARDGSLERKDLGGATCTLSNLGAYPVDLFAPVIAGPQIALIATGRLAERPVVSGGAVGVGHRVWVNAAIDHRAADGEAGGRFLQALERHIADLPTTISQGPAQ